MSGETPFDVGTKARHLYEIDILRILTFACVIAVHTTSHSITAAQNVRGTPDSDDLGLYTLLSLVHFTREVFFALTAFVLVYSWFHRPRPMREFWPKRFLLVGVPYLVWSAIYVVVPYLRSPDGDLGGLLRDFGVDIVTGNAWYHLYFLLVTMQVYLILPLLLRLVQRTRGHHVAVGVVALVVQLILIGAYCYIPAVNAVTAGWIGSVFPTYIFFIVAGALLADHQVAFLAWVRVHRRGIAIGTLLIGAVYLVWVWLQRALLGFSYYKSGTPMQPAMVIWGSAIFLAFLAAGTWWADRRVKGSRQARFVDWASDRSFGIFLAHPLIIWLALWVGDDALAKAFPNPWLTLVVYLIAVFGAALISDVARRTPVSMPLTGRPFTPRAAARPREKVSAG